MGTYHAIAIAVAQHDSKTDSDPNHYLDSSLLGNDITLPSLSKLDYSETVPMLVP